MVVSAVCKFESLEVRRPRPCLALSRRAPVDSREEGCARCLFQPKKTRRLSFLESTDVAEAAAIRTALLAELKSTIGCLAISFSP